MGKEAIDWSLSSLFFLCDDLNAVLRHLLRRRRSLSGNQLLLGNDRRRRLERWRRADLWRLIRLWRVTETSGNGDDEVKETTVNWTEGSPYWNPEQGCHRMMMSWRSLNCNFLLLRHHHPLSPPVRNCLEGRRNGVVGCCCCCCGVGVGGYLRRWCWIVVFGLVGLKVV